MLTALREAIDQLENPAVVDGALHIEGFALQDRLQAFCGTTPPARSGYRPPTRTGS